MKQEVFPGLPVGTVLRSDGDYVIMIGLLSAPYEGVGYQVVNTRTGVVEAEGTMLPSAIEFMRGVTAALKEADVLPGEVEFH